MEFYQIIPPGAVPFGLLAPGEQFNRLVADGRPGPSVYVKIDEKVAKSAPEAKDIGFFMNPFELVRPVAPAPLGNNTAIVEDIRRQPAPVCVCSVCAGLLEPGECGCVCRVCATGGAPPRSRPMRRYVLHLCPCCAATVGSMDRWCSTCGQPMYITGGGVPF